MENKRKRDSHNQTDTSPLPILNCFRYQPLWQ